MNITIFRNFYKRTNSTKRPATTTGTTLQCKLKEETSIESPSFIIQMQNDFESINYVYALNHYYTVTDIIILDDNRIELACSQDVLATYRTNIKGLTTRVIYSSSNYDLMIKDNRMNASCDIEYHYNKGTTDAPFNKKGVYLLSCMNGYSSGTGGLASYYLLTESELVSLSANILRNPSFFQQLTGQFMNPMESLICCKWLPISASVVAGTRTNVFIGSEDTGVQGKLLTERVRNYTFSVNIPLQWNNPTYINTSPVSTGVLYLPFVGAVDVDLDTRFNNELITGDLYFDAFTGDVAYVIDTGGKVVTYSGNCSTTIPLSASGYNPTGVLTSTASIIGGAMTLNPSAIVSGAMHMFDSLSIHTQQNGSVSSVLGAYTGLDVLCVVYQHKLTDDVESLKDVQGLPCYKVLNLGNLAGYVQTEKASINIAGRTTDSQRINALLDSGIYLE